MTIWRLATNVEYRTLSELFGIGKSTISEIVIETCNAITSHLLPKYVYISKDENWKEIVERFETYWGFLLAARANDGQMYHFTSR